MSNKIYHLMNKNSIVLSFRTNPELDFSEDVSFSVLASEQPFNRQTPFGFRNITSWIEGRKASKHNRHLKRIMEQFNCADNEGFIQLTHAVGVNDTFWIKSDNENIAWEDVSLYKNEFSEIVSRLAFEGAGLYESSEIFSSTSPELFRPDLSGSDLSGPELSGDGSFRKCYRKEKNSGQFGSDIFIYKRGGELGKGLEPYCEVLASEIANIISPSSVNYELTMLHGKRVSKCNLFTNEHIGYASFSKLSPTHSLSDVHNFFTQSGFEQSFREMLVVDSLCFNQDRHSGNYGVLFDNDTLEIVSMAPIFDLNLSLLPYADMTDFERIGDKLFEYAPKLGDDFTRIGQIAVNDIIRERLKDIKDFSFSFRGDENFSEERVKNLEKIVQRQADAILSKDKLRTRDVFISQTAILRDKKEEQASQAASLMDEFYSKIENMNFASDSILSICEGLDTVQIYFENESYLFGIDFLNNKTFLHQNAQDITLEDIKDAFPAFYKDVINISEVLYDFWNKKGLIKGILNETNNNLDDNSINTESLDEDILDKE